MQVTYKEELAPVSFIAGDYQEFEYTIMDIDTNQPVKLSSEANVEKFEMVLFRYGDSDNPVLKVSGVKRPSSSAFTVCLGSEITEALDSGLYIQQPIITDRYGRIFRPCQGTVNILSRGKEENI